MSREEYIGKPLTRRDPESIQEILEEKARKAVETAGKYGALVGYVSRFSPVSVDLENATVTFDIDPSIYYSRLNDPSNPLYRMGSILAIVDPKTLHLVSVRVKEIRRLDELAGLGVDEPLGTPLRPDTSTLMTRTKIIGEILLEYDPVEEKAFPSNLSIEPQSPVIDPDPGVLAKLLGLPGREEGVLLGSLSFNSVLVKNGEISLVLPYKVMLQHTLILGTTGSGKTTLVKNMIASTLSDNPGKVTVVFDLNQDYIQLLLPPLEKPGRGEEARVYSSLYNVVSEPDSIIIVSPVSREIIGSPYKDSAAYNLDSVFRLYFEDSYEPLLSLIGAEAGDGELVVERGAAYYRFKVQGKWKKIIFIPYSINTQRLTGDAIVSLMPGLTDHARNILRRLRRKVEISLPPSSPKPFIDLYLYSIWVYKEDMKKKDSICNTRSDETWFTKRVLELVKEKLLADYPSMEDALEAVLNNYYHIPIIICQALKEISPHRSTLDNLYRELATLVDTGIVDVVIGYTRDRLVFQGEPGWSRLIQSSLEHNAPIIVDLAWSYRASSLGENTHRITAIRLLSTLLKWKHEMWKDRRATPDVHVYIDEAHQFFPNETRDEGVRQLSSTLSRIARLGRARGIGLVFATHSPGDLNDIIIQLTNTKIILRMDPHHLEKLDIPAETRRHLALAPPRHFAVKSYYIPNGLITGVTTTPVTLHYDISA